LCEHYKITDLAAGNWMMTPGVGLASFTGRSFGERRTDTLASDWVTDVSWQKTLRTFCSHRVQQSDNVHNTSL